MVNASDTTTSSQAMSIMAGISQGMSVRALAHVIAGHELHHRAILEQRYLAQS